MMANYHILVVAFSILVFNNIYFVQCVDQCKTHKDCKEYVISSPMYCCGGYVYSFYQDKQRRCRYGTCLNRYCSTNSDCGDSTMCCRSNRCVNKGCSGCTKNSDCYSSQVCCKKTFPFNQTVCAADCLKQTCNFNDDCAGYGECCRSGKCASTGCYYNKCTSNSECNKGQYCCKKKTDYYYRDGCSETCVGEICSTNEDCGAPNECCISNKCVDRGCSGCTTNSNCSTGQYCCKKRQWYELSECSAHCIGKSCNTNDDCGGPGEVCQSYLCLNETGRISGTIGISGSATSTVSVKEFTKKYSKCSTPLPSWVIAIITICLVVFLIAIGILLAVFFCMKRKRSADATDQAGNLSLQNIQYQAGAEILNQPNTQTSHPNNPIYHASVVQSQNSTILPQRNRNHVFHINPCRNNDSKGYQAAMPSDPAQSDNEVRHYDNDVHDPVYRTLESQDAPQDTHSGGHIYECPMPK